jgi:fused signal recognition particle receptor
MEMDLIIYLVSGAIGLTGLGAGFYFFRKPKKAKKPQSAAKPIPVPSPSTTAPEPAEPTTVSVAQPSPPVKARKELKSLEDALARTREGFWGKLKNQFSGQPSIGSADIEDLEEALYTSDLGPKTVDRLITNVSAKLSQHSMSVESLHQSLKEELQGIFSSVASTDLDTQATEGPTVWMIVGVNGAGKTTTIGKLASQQVAKGKKVLIAAGDTFRAAADEQLKVWATRAEVEIFSPDGLKDPSAVAFDAVKKGASKGFDLVIIDTAGRLHTQKNLMEELKKMKRVMSKAREGAPHETLLVLDANSGQNALLQTEQFHQALEVSGVILTKMDGSAKGGVAVGIACEHHLPIRMIGVGEQIEDLRPFNSQEFVDSIL